MEIGMKAEKKVKECKHEPDTRIRYRAPEDYDNSKKLDSSAKWNR